MIGMLLFGVYTGLVSIGFTNDVIISASNLLVARIESGRRCGMGGSSSIVRLTAAISTTSSDSSIIFLF